MSFAISVICLGVVLIIAWPKINKIIDDSHENIFKNKVKDMIASVGKTYVENNSRSYSNVINGIPHLKNVNEKYQYIMYVNDTGYVTSFKVTNGDYKIEGENADGVKVDEIGSSYSVIHAKEKSKFILKSDGSFEEKK